MRKLAKYLIVLLFTAALLLVALWSTSPALLQMAAQRFAPQYEITNLVLEVERPRLDRIAVPRLSFAIGQFELSLERAVIRYAPLQGQIVFVEIDSLSLSQTTQVTPAESGPDQGTTLDGLDPQQIFTYLPPGTISTLAVALDSIGFAGTGSAVLNDDGLTLKMAGLTPEYARHFRLDLLVRPWGDIAFDFFTGEQAAAPVVTLAVSIADNALQMDAQYDLTGYPLTLLSEVFALPQGSGRVMGELHASLPWPIEVGQLTDQTVTGALQADWRSDDLGLAVERLNLAFAGSTERIDGVLEGGRVTLVDPKLSLTLPQGLKVNYADSRFTFGAGVRYQFEQDVTTRFTGTINELLLNTGEPLSLETKLAFNAVYDEYRSSGTLLGKFSLKQDILQGSGQLQRKSRRAPFKLSYNLTQSSGSATSQATYAITQPFVTELLDNWREPYDLHSGQLDIVASYSWTPSTNQGNTTINLRESTVHYEDLVATGVAGSFKLTIKNDDVALQRSGFSVGEIDVGVGLKEMTGDVAWQGDRLRLNNVRTKVLGGTASSDEIVVAVEALDATFQIELDQIDLGQVLALEGEDIKGTGTLRGRLPIRVRQGAVNMTNGQVEALPPGGKIQLSSALAAATGQPGLDFAMNALTNFDYEKLDVTANYADNGDLALAVALRGRNPSVEKGRAIHYNLTINENVHALLEALRAQSEVTDRIERKVQEKNKLKPVSN